MLCERYKEALTQAAASETPLQSAVRDHLDDCPRCRADFVSERALFAAIDSSSRSVANFEPPFSFSERVRARLAEQSMQRPAGILTWALGFAAVVAAFAIVAGLSQRIDPPNAQTVANVPASPATGNLISATPNPVRPVPSRRTARKQRLAQAHMPEQAPDAQVLVPSDERDAFAKFIADLNADQSVASVLLRPLAEGPDQGDDSVQISELQVAELEVEPLLEERRAISDRDK
jgi:hypothetical protein